MSSPAPAPTRDALAARFLPRPGAPPVEWAISDALVPYQQALTEMEARAAQIARGEAPERVWLLEHPPLYTSGTSAKPGDLLDARRLDETGLLDSRAVATLWQRHQSGAWHHANGLWAIAMFERWRRTHLG